MWIYVPSILRVEDMGRGQHNGDDDLVGDLLMIATMKKQLSVVEDLTDTSPPPPPPPPAAAAAAAAAVKVFSVGVGSN